MHGTPANLQDTGNYDAWVRTLTDGAPTEPMLMQTYPPDAQGLRSTFGRKTTLSRSAQPEEDHIPIVNNNAIKNYLR